MTELMMHTDVVDLDRELGARIHNRATPQTIRVSELIEFLRKCHPDSLVFMSTPGYYDYWIANAEQSCIGRVYLYTSRRLRETEPLAQEADCADPRNPPQAHR